jgi:hypothetical protein
VAHALLSADLVSFSFFQCDVFGFGCVIHVLVPCNGFSHDYAPRSGPLMSDLSYAGFRSFVAAAILRTRRFSC